MGSFLVLFTFRKMKEIWTMSLRAEKKGLSMYRKGSCNKEEEDANWGRREMV
jgi:hypothetical protein